MKCKPIREQEARGCSSTRIDGCCHALLDPILRGCCATQMDGPGLHYIRASYRKQAAQVAEGKSRMLRSRPPAEAQAGPNLLAHPLAALLA